MNVKPVRRILVPTDFSACSGTAADFAAQLAEQLDATIQLVTVVDTTPLLDAYGDVAFRNERIADIRGKAREQLDRFAQQHLSGLQHLDVQVRDGNTFLEILQAARDADCHLIVMGTHGRTGLVHLVIGSVAEKVVRHSSIPVLTVRPE